MLMHVMTVRDSASEAYSQPFCVVSIGGSTRSFADQVNNPEPNNNYNKHPDDFELYHLGTFDDHSATYELFDKPRLVARAKDLKTK